MLKFDFRRPNTGQESVAIDGMLTDAIDASSWRSLCSRNKAHESFEHRVASCARRALPFAISRVEDLCNSLDSADGLKPFDLLRVEGNPSRTIQASKVLTQIGEMLQSRGIGIRIVEDGDATHQKVTLVTDLTGIKATVSVSTSTAIIHSVNDPYRVLVSESLKHPKPVLQGGKVEEIDRSTQDPFLACIYREVPEEIGTELKSVRKVGVATDTHRDIRLVRASKLRGVSLSSDICGLDDSDMVRASYGSPDSIYVGSVSEPDIISTSELQRSWMIDVRDVQVGDLSVGHDILLILYREMCDRGEEILDARCLADFELVRSRFR